jgi:ankyrin repeat protein
LNFSPISLNDDNPADKACDIVLRGGISKEVAEILRCLTEGNDFIDNQNFASVHKIVLRLSMRDLEEAILADPENIDIPDAMGRTALEWAAARGDERSVTLLLSYGADPNNMDKKLNTPLTLAANQNHTVCVRLLLEAGADPDPELPNGIKFGTPLNCAARNASDPLLLKTLLDFNADIEASNVDMVTPLLHVARRQTASHAMLLLEYGANINATSKDGLTPLTTSIIYNNHGVLQLLLDRWFEYSECPRLKGPHLLELVAQYADLKTISILASANHFKLKFDKTYALGDFAKRLKQRPNVEEKLLEAFDGLLDIITQGLQVKTASLESRMESGLLLRRDSSLEEDESCAKSPSSEESFQDAHENWIMSSEERFSTAHSMKKRATM